MKRWLIVTLLLIFLFGIWSVASPAPSAHALGVDLQCSGTATAHFTPGLTNTPQSVAISAQNTFSPCLLPLGFTGGTAATSVSITASCTSLAFSSHTTTYHWNNGSTSVVSYGTTTVTREADGTSEIVGVGTVISGMDTGDTATETIVLPNLDVAACNTPAGLTSASGPIEIIFTSL